MITGEQYKQMAEYNLSNGHFDDALDNCNRAIRKGVDCSYLIPLIEDARKKKEEELQKKALEIKKQKELRKQQLECRKSKQTRHNSPSKEEIDRKNQSVSDTIIRSYNLKSKQSCNRMRELIESNNVSAIQYVLEVADPTFNDEFELMLLAARKKNKDDYHIYSQLDLSTKNGYDRICHYYNQNPDKAIRIILTKADVLTTYGLKSLLMIRSSFFDRGFKPLFDKNNDDLYIVSHLDDDNFIACCRTIISRYLKDKKDCPEEFINNDNLAAMYALPFLLDPNESFGYYYLIQNISSKWSQDIISHRSNSFSSYGSESLRCLSEQLRKEHNGDHYVPSTTFFYSRKSSYHRSKKSEPCLMKQDKPQTIVKAPRDLEGSYAKNRNLQNQTSDRYLDEN